MPYRMAGIETDVKLPMSIRKLAVSISIALLLGLGSHLAAGGPAVPSELAGLFLAHAQ